MDRKVAYSLGLLATAFAALLVAYAQATEIAATAWREPFLSERAVDGSASRTGQQPGTASAAPRSIRSNLVSD